MLILICGWFFWFLVVDVWFFFSLLLFLPQTEKNGYNTQFPSHRCLFASGQRTFNTGGIFKKNINFFFLIFLMLILIACWFFWYWVLGVDVWFFFFFLLFLPQTEKIWYNTQFPSHICLFVSGVSMGTWPLGWGTRNVVLWVGRIPSHSTVCLLLWIDKSRVEDKRYICVSVWWKTTN